MKICILTHNLDTRNGGGRFARELINHLEKLDNNLEIKILTTVKSGHNSEEAIIYPRKIKLFFSLPKIRRIIKNYDLVHAFDSAPYGIIAYLAAWGLNKRIIITAIGSGSIKPLYNFWLFPLIKWIYRKADKIIAISSYTAGEINKKVKDLKIKIIPLGINYQYFLEKSQLSAQGDEVEEIKKYRPYILSVGKIKPRKGYHVSLRVFARLSQQIPNLKYIIVGSGRGLYYRKLKNLIQELGIDKKVIFRQNISDKELSLYYQNAELFLLLSQNINYDIEGFGLVFLEAAVFGLPIIGTLDSGAEDAVLDKINGFLVNPQDLNGAVKRIARILDDQDLKTRFSKNSVEFAKQMSWRSVAEKYFKIYKNL